MWGAGILNGTGMAKERGGKGLGERSPGSKGDQASSVCAKYTKRESLQTTPKDGSEHGEGKADSQKTGVRRTQRHHLGPAGD